MIEYKLRAEGENRDKNLGFISTELVLSKTIGLVEIVK